MTTHQTYDEAFFVNEGPLGLPTVKYYNYPDQPFTSRSNEDQAIGYLREYVDGMRRYEQSGTDIPDFNVRTDYEQEQGGPLVSRTIRYSPPNAIIRAPHLNSPYMDQLIERGYKPLKPPGPRGPQLPDFL